MTDDGFSRLWQVATECSIALCLPEPDAIGLALSMYGAACRPAQPQPPIHGQSYVVLLAYACRSILVPWEPCSQRSSRPAAALRRISECSG